MDLSFVRRGRIGVEFVDVEGWKCRRFHSKEAFAFRKGGSNVVGNTDLSVVVRQLVDQGKPLTEVFGVGRVDASLLGEGSVDGRQEVLDGRHLTHPGFLLCIGWKQAIDSRAVLGGTREFGWRHRVCQMMQGRSS